MDVLFGEHKVYEQFFTQLKGAILESNITTVAGMVHYPLRVRSNKKTLVINNVPEFRQNYKKIINQDVIQSIKDQSFESLTVNNAGVLVGQGKIWFSGICNDARDKNDCEIVDVKVISINL